MKIRMKSLDKEKCPNCGTGTHGEDSLCDNCWEEYLNTFCRLISTKNHKYVYAIRTLENE